MTNEQITEAKKVMAEFMGYKYYQFPGTQRYAGWRLSDKPILEKFMHSGLIGKRPYLGRTTKSLKFNDSWNWLHPVWEKLRDLRFENLESQFNHTEIKERLCHEITYGTLQSSFEKLGEAVIWYQSLKK